jgi:hypothetical protein
MAITVDIVPPTRTPPSSSPAASPPTRSDRALLPRWAEAHAGVEAILRKRLFFVVGCQKSGTTWIMRLLNEHPEIACGGEACFGPMLLPALQQAVQAYNQNQRGGKTIQITDRQFEYLCMTAMGLVLGNLAGQRDVKCIGEKTPEHALSAPLFASLFPESKFIQIIRDGRDAATSGWFYNIQLKGDAFRQQFPNLTAYVELFVRGFWVPYIQTARSVGQAAPDRYIECRYEDLHADPDGTIRRLLTFLDVSASEASVAACRDGASFERLSGGRRVGQTDNGSFFRKGIVGDWKNHFDEAALEMFMRYGGDLLRELGYA